MIFMPVTSPPNSGPLGRSRSRISASGYSTWSRCPKQWFLTRKVGLSSPTSVFQILGVVVEDGLIDLLMHRPDNFSSFEELHNWAKQKIPEIAINGSTLAWKIGKTLLGARRVLSLKNSELTL